MYMISFIGLIIMQLGKSLWLFQLELKDIQIFRNQTVRQWNFIIGPM